MSGSWQEYDIMHGNQIGATQSATDRDRAEIALSYHCLSLMDIFWTREKDENLDFSQVNLYENHRVSLCGCISER